jgi:hypothetical protein
VNERVAFLGANVPFAVMTAFGVAGVMKTPRVPARSVLRSVTDCGAIVSEAAAGCARTFAVVVTTGVPAEIERPGVPGRSVLRNANCCAATASEPAEG